MSKDKAIDKIKSLRDFELKLAGSSDLLIAGIDEAGRGPLAGPVVAAAAIIFDTEGLSGINDSKQVSEKKREEIFDAMLENENILLGIGVVDIDDIDEINILQATHKAMNIALNQLSQKPQFLVVDGLLLNQQKKPDIPQQKVIKGDAKCLSIAAASIAAKVTRDRIMLDIDKKYPEYGFASHKGYGTKKHIEAIKNHGILDDVHRKTFAPISTMLSQLELF